MDKNNEYVHAYVAGIIDGEGGIRIRKDIKKTKPNEKPTFNGDVKVGMTDEEPIQLLQNLYGGSKYIEKRRSENEKDIYRWHLSGNKSVPIFLKKILPYLIVKKKQADLVLEFIDKRMNGLGMGKNGGIPEKEYEWREEMFKKMKVLNNRKSGKNE